MSFIDRLESERTEKRLRKQASDALKTLANALAVLDLNPAAGLYTALIELRQDKARRAYNKALEALTADEPELAFECAERGMVHLEMAQYHSVSSGPQDDCPLVDLSGPARAAISRLSAALTEFKQLVEYRNLVLPEVARQKLECAAQLLQDSIEDLGFGHNQKAAVSAESGLVWLNFSAAQVIDNPGEMPSSLLKAQILKSDGGNKDFARLLEHAIDSGQKLARSALLETAQQSSHEHALATYLESALGAYVDRDADELERYLDLFKLQSDLLVPVALDKKDETRSVKSVIKELKQMCGKYCSDPRAAARILDNLTAEIKAFDYAVTDSKAQQTLYRQTNIKALRRELKTMLIEQDLL